AATRLPIRSPPLVVTWGKLRASGRTRRPLLTMPGGGHTGARGMDSSRIHQGLLRSTSGSSAGPLPLPSPATGAGEASLREVTSAVGRTRARRIDAQHEDGYGVGGSEGDTNLGSEYVLLLAWMGREKSEAAIAA